jgi:hypothetical protein
MTRGLPIEPQHRHLSKVAGVSYQVSALWHRTTKKEMAQLNTGGLNLYEPTKSHSSNLELQVRTTCGEKPCHS